MLNDLRHAVRLLMRAKAWTSVIVTSLALGIGANAALFSAVNGLLFRTLAVKDPGSLVRLRYAGDNSMATGRSDYGYSSPARGGLPARATFSYPIYQQFVSDNRTMSGLVASAPLGAVNVVVDGRAEIASAMVTSGNFYQALGVPARLGRTIGPDDDRADAPPAAVISHRYWRARFGGDPSVVGKVVRMNETPVTIVGVLAPDFAGVMRTFDRPSDIGVPLSLDRQLSGQDRVGAATLWWLNVLGRLEPGVTPAQVEANLGSVFEQTAKAGMASYLASLPAAERSLRSNQNRNAVPRLSVDSGSRGVYNVNLNDIRTVTVLGVVVALVLLIVCANVANLLLSRALSRQKELSVRLSLGASRLRLVRQLLTESLLLAALGALGGILLGYWARKLLPGGAGQATAMDWRMLYFLLAITTVTGVLFGIAPALRATGRDTSTALKEHSRTVAGTRSLLARGLLVVQVAVSLVLLVGAGLFLQTLQNLRGVDVGFDPDNLVLFRINPRLNRYGDDQTQLLYQRIADRLRAAPGIQAVSLSNMALLTGSRNTTSVYLPGGSSIVEGDMHRLTVSPEFFETMGMRLVAGRGFTPRDDASSTKVAVINETAGRRLFPNENPLGRRFGTSVETSDTYEIVGVLGDTKYSAVREPTPATMYVPQLQNRVVSAMFEVKTAGDPSAAIGPIREAIREIDPNLPLTEVSTQAQQLEGRLAQERVFAQAYTLFGALAALLAAVGLFGVMSYNVARRTNEIGVRLALGAQARDVLRMVLGEAMTLVTIGLAIGLIGATAAGRVVASQLFGLAATDVATLLAAALLMIVVSAVAGYLPARRASRVDPMQALRWE